MKKGLALVAVSLLFCILCGLLILRWTIQSGLNEISREAQSAHPHPGDNIGALIEVTQTESHTLKERNRAVWALGQARDDRALPVLRQFRTGNDCDHDHALCQHELEKAINLCSGQTLNLLWIQAP
jgi:hypothetical protein